LALRRWALLDRLLDLLNAQREIGSLSLFRFGLTLVSGRLGVFRLGCARCRRFVGRGG
jgi:hypothetical protein